MTEEPNCLWQKQPRDGFKMDLDRLRTLVRAQDARTRRRRSALLLQALGGASLAAYLAFALPLPLLRFGLTLLAAGFIGFLGLSWRGTKLAPGEDNAQVCVEFLRMQLRQRRSVARGGWLVRCLPLLPGLAVTLAAVAIASGREWQDSAPVIALFVGWVVAMLVVQSRRAAEVDAEIAELDRLGGA